MRFVRIALIPLCVAVTHVTACAGSRLSVWAIVPFEVSPIVEITLASIRDRSCHFRARILPSEAKFFARLGSSVGDGRIVDGEIRAALAGVRGGTIYVDRFGAIRQGEDEGLLSNNDFTELRRIVYRHAEVAGCASARGSNPYADRDHLPE